MDKPQYGSGPHYNHLHNAAIRRKKSKKMDCYGYGKRTDTRLTAAQTKSNPNKKEGTKIENANDFLFMTKKVVPVFNLFVGIRPSQVRVGFHL